MWSVNFIQSQIIVFALIQTACLLLREVGRSGSRLLCGFGKMECKGRRGKLYMIHMVSLSVIYFFEHNHCLNQSFYFLMYVAYMTKYWGHEEDWSWNFNEFTCFEPPRIWRGGFWNVVYVCMYLVTLAPEWFNRFYSCSYYRILTMVYNFQKYWVFGLYPSSWY
jgi:hypothetical protein